MRRIMKRWPLLLAALLIVWVPLRTFGAETENVKKKPAVVVVRLPAAAELIIGGVKSKQRTAVREFDTPPLTPGKKFSYPVKAVWKAGDKDVTRETTIVVTAGETTEIDMLALKLSPPIAEKLAAPDLFPEIAIKPAPKAEPEKKPKPKPEPIEKPEPKPVPEKKPDPKPGPIKKPQVKPEPIKKPKPELIKKPKPKPKPEKKPEAKPEPPSASPKPVLPTPAAKGTLSLLLPETLNLHPGGTKLMAIKVVRAHWEGPVSITFEGLPSGIELKNATVAANKQKAYVRAVAGANAEEKEWEVKVIGISGSIRQEATLNIKIAK